MISETTKFTSEHYLYPTIQHDFFARNQGRLSIVIKLYSIDAVIFVYCNGHHRVQSLKQSQWLPSD